MLVYECINLWRIKMKKLLTLLVCCSLSAPSFGVDWIRDRIYTFSSYGMLGVNYDLGYHCTDRVKISFAL